MNNSNFSLANRKQLADLLADKYDSMRHKAKSKFREKHNQLYFQYLNESAEKKSALKIVEQIDAARLKITDLQNDLCKLGFQEHGGDPFPTGSVGDSIRKSIEARVDKEIGNIADIDARYDSVQLAMMTVATLEDAEKLLKSVSEI